MRVHEFRSFVTNSHAGGNLAVVVDGADGIPDSTLQTFARDFLGEVTCIYRTPDSPRLRFFLPTAEMSFCGHGLLAAAVVLTSGSGQYTVQIGEEHFSGAVSDDPAPYVDVTLRLGEAELIRDDSARLCTLAALGLPPEALLGNLVVNAGTARQKTLVELQSDKWLNSISTTEAAVDAACQKLGSTGLYPFVCIGPGRFSARHFPANAGFLEDPATGNAIVALASARASQVLTSEMYDQDHYIVHQGAAMGVPCTLHARFTSATTISLGGLVSTALL